MDMEIKGFGGFEVKNADKGEVSAIVATLNVKDRDGDVFLPGSFVVPARVQISDYKHSVVLAGAAPVGKGVVSVEDNLAIFRGQYFLGTERGRESFQVVKEIGEDGDWSFAFPRQAAKIIAPTKEWQGQGVRKLYAGSVTPIEVSPVLVGGGIGTRTLAAKEGQRVEMLKGPHRVTCGCGRNLGDSPEPLIFVGKVRELSEVETVTKGIRDVRFCRSCGRHAVSIPATSLTRQSA